MPTRCRSSTRRLDKEVERVAIGLGGGTRLGSSPQALVFSESGRTLLVANAQSQSVAVVALSRAAAGLQPSDADWDDKGEQDDIGSQPRGRLHPDRSLSVRAGRGRTDACSSATAKASQPRGRTRPTTRSRPTHKLRGAYSVSLMRSSIRRVTAAGSADARGDDDAACCARTGWSVSRASSLFAGPSPITHVIYVIKENRTYDQVFGDVAASGDGRRPTASRRWRSSAAGDAARRGRRAAGHHAESPRARAALRAVRSLLRQLRSEPGRPQLGRRRRSPATTWTRRSAGATRAAAARTTTKDSTGCPTASRPARCLRRCSCRSPRANCRRSCALRALSERIARRRGAGRRSTSGMRPRRRACAIATTASSSRRCRAGTWTR